jgi:hypothetical protein
VFIVAGSFLLFGIEVVERIKIHSSPVCNRAMLMAILLSTILFTFYNFFYLLVLSSFIARLKAYANRA